MSARPPNVCPTCGSAFVWPCTASPCKDVTAPDPWHQPPRDSTGWGQSDATFRRFVRRMDITENQT